MLSSDVSRSIYIVFGITGLRVARLTARTSSPRLTHFSRICYFKTHHLEGIASFGRSLGVQISLSLTNKLQSVAGTQPRCSCLSVLKCTRPCGLLRVSKKTRLDGQAISCKVKLKFNMQSSGAFSPQGPKWSLIIIQADVIVETMKAVFCRFHQLNCQWFSTKV